MQTMQTEQSLTRQSGNSPSLYLAVSLLQSTWCFSACLSGTRLLCEARPTVRLICNPRHCHHAILSDLIGRQGCFANRIRFNLLRLPSPTSTMANSICSDDAHQPRTRRTWDEEDSQYAPTPGYFGCTPSVISPSPAPVCATNPVQSDQLGFLPLDE